VGLGFGVWIPGLGFGVWGLGFEAQGSGFRVQSSGFGLDLPSEFCAVKSYDAQGFEFRVYCVGYRGLCFVSRVMWFAFRFKGSECRGEG